MLVLSIVSLTACLTTKVDITIEPVIIPIPEPPLEPNLNFIHTESGDQVESGNWLSDIDSKGLLIYLLQLNAYVEKLKVLLGDPVPIE